MDLRLDGRIILVVGGHGLLGSAVVARLRAEAISGESIAVGHRMRGATGL